MQTLASMLRRFVQNTIYDNGVLCCHLLLTWMLSANHKVDHITLVLEERLNVFVGIKLVK